MNWHSAISSTISERVQNLQSQLFPISAVSPQGKISFANYVNKIGLLAYIL